MIEVKKLGKRFGEFRAVTEVTFSVAAGEIVGFLGPNGAGKTTTMRILACFFPPSEGNASIGGYDVFEDSRQVRSLIGYMPENPPLYNEMIIEDYLRFVATLSAIPSREVRSAVGRVMELTGITHRKNSRIAHLSKGYRQRVGLAQALVHDPKVLILDEPSSGLDPKQITEIRALITSLAGDHTILLSTHILHEVEQTCDRVIIIDQGQIKAKESLQVLSERMTKSLRLRLALDKPPPDLKKALKDLVGIISVKKNQETEDGVNSKGNYLLELETDTKLPQQISALAVNKGWGLSELAPIRPTLEEIYLRLLSSDKATEDQNA